MEYVSYGYHSANTTKCSIPHRLKPQTDSDRGEETRERQIFCPVWRETSESASGNSDRRGGDPPGMVSVRSGRAVLCCVSEHGCSCVSAPPRSLFRSYAVFLIDTEVFSHSALGRRQLWFVSLVLRTGCPAVCGVNLTDRRGSGAVAVDGLGWVHRRSLIHRDRQICDALSYPRVKTLHLKLSSR